MKAFVVKGKFLMGDRWQEFTKELVGNDENGAREEIFSRLGSKHKVKRAKIHISEVKEIPPNKVSDPITKFQLKGKKTVKGEKNE